MYLVLKTSENKFSFLKRAMEEDRAEADVGPVIDPVVPGAKQETPRQPSRRFVGRKTAAASAHQRAETNGHIESSTAVQGLSVSSMQEKIWLMAGYSYSTKATREGPEPDSIGNPKRPCHQRCYFSPSVQLLFRNPQDHPPHTDVGFEEDCLAVS